MNGVEHSLGELQAALVRYAVITGKTPQEVLDKKGRSLSIALNARFRDVPPRALRPTIYNKAQSIKYALKNLSPKAAQFADNYMSGNESIVGNVMEIGPGVIDIRSARVGKRGRRIYGGRRGRGGRAASLAEYQSEGFNDRYAPGSLDGEHVLNRRAVTVFFALMLRLRGSGSLANAWLQKDWKKSGMAGAFLLENVNPKAITTKQGSARLDLNPDGGAVTLTNLMPGAARFPGAIALAIRDETADIGVYFARQLDLAAKKARLG